MTRYQAAPSLLLDTNIWIDNYNAARPRSQEARNLIDFALEHAIPLYYSPMSLKDVFFLVYHSLKKTAESGARVAPQRKVRQRQPSLKHERAPKRTRKQGLRCKGIRLGLRFQYEQHCYDSWD